MLSFPASWQVASDDKLLSPSSGHSCILHEFDVCYVYGEYSLGLVMSGPTDVVATFQHQGC